MDGSSLTFFEVAGTRMAARLAGEADRPALLLLHGFPSSSRMFRGVIPELSKICRVIAPDLPGFGASEPIERPSFARFADLLELCLDQLRVETYYLYLHDFGAAAALYLATRHPERVRGLIIQNANAHRAGFGPLWADTLAFWEHPTAETERKATAHLTFEGTRDQYVGGVPSDLAARIDPACWQEDWDVMTRPGRLQTQRALVLDYRHHAERFDEIASYLAEHQPPALLLWGRHDPFFELEETVCWMRALPRMEAHVLDGPHFLLETHAARCATLMTSFLTPAATATRGA